LPPAKGPTLPVTRHGDRAHARHGVGGAEPLRDKYGHVPLPTDSLPTQARTVQTPRSMWLTWEMWGLSALILLGGEVWSQNFVFLWPAIAAGATAIGALFGLSENNQLLLFSILSMVLLTLSRTLLKKALFPEHNRLRSNADAIPGTLVEVIERVGNQENPGTVQLGGEVWSAYSHDGRWLDPGHQARVIKVDGLKLVVEPKAP